MLGATVDPLALGDMLDLVPAAALELCEAALEARLLVVSGRDYEFANDLIREALYASTPEPTRLAHHRRAADLLTGQPESLARHAAAAGDWLRAARAWLRAGEDAMGRYAASDAAALATQALEAGERVADAEVSARALVLRGRALEAVGRPRRRARRPDPGCRRRPRGRRPPAGDARPARARRRRPGLAAACPSATTRPTWRAVCGSPNRSGTGPARRTCSPASPSSRPTGCSLDAALDYGLRAVAAGRAAADDQALAAGLDGLKIAYLSLGDTRALTDVLAELIPLLRRRGDLFLLQWAEFEGAFLAVAAADLEQASAAIEKAIELNHRSGYPHCEAWYTAHLGWLARLRGQDDKAADAGPPGPGADRAARARMVAGHRLRHAG